MKTNNSWKAFLQGAASIFCPGVIKIEPLREVECKADIGSCWKAVGDYMRTALGYIDEEISQQPTDNKNTPYDMKYWSSTL